MSNEYKDWLADLSEEERFNYELCMKYPFLLSPEEDTYDYSYFPVTIPEGWKSLFIDMCQKLKEILIKHNALNNYYFLDVKEKYFSLVCYANTYIEEAEELFREYRKRSGKICLCCGKELSDSEKYFCTTCSSRY